MDSIAFNSFVKNTHKPLIVYFTATWCVPCKMMAPAIENVRHDYRDRVEFIKLDADAHAETVRELKVYGIPTLIGYNNGAELFRRTGAQTGSQLTEIFESLSQNRQLIKGIQPIERIVRLGIGTAMLLLGWFSMSSWFMIGAGGLIAFSAVYDRCPIYKALTTAAKDLWAKIRYKNLKNCKPE